MVSLTTLLATIDFTNSDFGTTEEQSTLQTCLPINNKY